MSNKRRVEITEETGVKLGRMQFMLGDVVSLDRDLADMVIEQGWGKDVETGEQGDRKPGSVKIKTDSVVHKLSSL